MSPKQVVGFTCVSNSEVDQLIRKSSVLNGGSGMLATRNVSNQNAIRGLFEICSGSFPGLFGFLSGSVLDLCRVRKFFVGPPPQPKKIAAPNGQYGMILGS